MTGEVVARPEATVIIAATTAGATSPAFRVGTSATSVSTIGALGAGENATIQRQASDATWTDYKHSFLGAFVISGTDAETSITIYDTGIYRVVLDATAGAVGIEIQGRDYC